MRVCMCLCVCVCVCTMSVCVSFHANALGKGIRLSVLPPAMSKQESTLSSFVLVRQPLQEMEN